MRDVLEHEIHQRDDQDGYQQDHRDTAVISGKLPENPRRSGRVVLQR